MQHKATLVWDDEKHTTVHLGMSNHEGESDAAYLRKVVEFYEMNKSNATNQQLILQRLASIERMLKSGVVTATETNNTDDWEADEIFDEALEQLE